MTPRTRHWIKTALIALAVVAALSLLHLLVVPPV